MFVDIDECATGLDMCDHNCTNTPGSYVCSCYEGYYEDGHRCIGNVKWMNYILDSSPDLTRLFSV